MNAPTLAAWTGEAAGYATITAPLNVRADPDLSALVVAVLPPGAEVIVWCACGPWRLIGPAGRPTGWAHSALLALPCTKTHPSISATPRGQPPPVATPRPTPPPCCRSSPNCCRPTARS